MRYVKWLDRPVVTQKHTRWRSSSTEWDSWPTKQWAGKSRNCEENVHHVAPNSGRNDGCRVSTVSTLSFTKWGFCLWFARSDNCQCGGHSCCVNAGVNWFSSAGRSVSADRWGGSGHGTHGAGLLPPHQSQQPSGWDHSGAGPLTCQWCPGWKQVYFVLLIKTNVPPSLNTDTVWLCSN